MVGCWNGWIAAAEAPAAEPPKEEEPKEEEAPKGALSFSFLEPFIEMLTGGMVLWPITFRPGSSQRIRI